MANIGKKQIATYNNKVVHIVPEYNRHKPENIDGKITITKTSVISGTYAKYSRNEQTEGMYILAHTINDGHYNSGDWNEYTTHQLVAKDDLNYRFLLPTGEDNTSPTYNALLASCVNSSNTDRTISRDDGHNTYRTELTPSRGYSKVPAGRIEKQKEDGTWDSVYSWNTPSDRVRITVENVDGNLRFVFDTDCVYELTVYTVIDDNIDPEKTEKIDKVCHTRITLADFVEEITGTTFIGVKDVNGHTITDEDTEDFCGNTSIYVNYTTNEYTVTNNIDPNCATVEISNPTPEYGDTVVIIIGKKSDKANIGAGSISMEGANNPIYSWNKTTESTLRYSIDSVIGNITIDSNECGDPANHPVQLEWYNDEEPESDPAIRSINVPHGNIIHPNDPNCTSTFTLPIGYEIKRSIPDMDREITITDDSTVIKYHYGLKEYIVTYIGDETVTINVSESGKVKHNEDITTQGVYTIGSGYQNANAIIVSGDATGVSVDNGSVTVTGVTSNVKVKISADSIPTHLYCVSFSIDQAGTFGADPDKTSRYCKIIQEGTCHKDIPYSLNSGYEIYGEIPSQITINTDNTIDVCNITENTELVIPVRLVTHTVRYCLTDGLGIRLIGAQGQCIAKTVTHGLNSTQEFSLTSGYNSVIIDSITPLDKPYNIDYDNNTININNITEDVEIWMHAGSIPNQDVTFKLFIDGVEKPDRETTKSVAYGSTANHSFRSLGIVIDRTDVNVTADVTGVRTDYHVLSDAAIGVSGTPITEATVITTYLKTVQQREVRSIEITSSKMDAMGGVVFNGKINYSEGEPDIITDQEEFNLKFEIRDSDNNLYDTTVVNVHDYDFEPKRDNSSSSVKDTEGNDISGGEQTEIQKIKLNLENTTSDSLSTLTSHSYDNRTIKITLKNSDKSNTLTIPQRAEKYGYYTNIDSTTPTSELSNTNWKTDKLVDFGDSVEMYEPDNDFILDESLKGKDIYNKDVTPYYITGTYVGNNPLYKLEGTDGTDYTIEGYTSNDYNTINPLYNEHYHMTWGEFNLENASGQVWSKGHIFESDSFTDSIDICGGVPEISTLSDENACTNAYSEDVSNENIEILEALGTNYSGDNVNHNVKKQMSYVYTVNYDVPSHNYGIDSISYYHIDNSEYIVKTISTEFKDEHGDDKQWSYPIHIKGYNGYNATSKDVSDLTSLAHTKRTGAGPTLGLLKTIRWNNSNISSIDYDPSSTQSYAVDDWSSAEHGKIYYDYNNKVKIISEVDSYDQDLGIDYINFEHYNNDYYDPSQTGSTFNEITLSQIPDEGYGYSCEGRNIDAYCTFVSSETLVRPSYDDDNQDNIKFLVLDPQYSNWSNISTTSGVPVKELNIDDYCRLSGRRARFISMRYIQSYLHNNRQGSYNDEPIENTVTVNGNTVTIPLFSLYPYDFTSDYNNTIRKNVDYNNIWVPINSEEEEKKELYYDEQGNESGFNWYYYNLSERVYISDPSNYKYSSSVYNKIAATKFKQYCNSLSPNERNFYAHNSDNAKYAICSHNFPTGTVYRIYDDDGYDITKVVLEAKIKDITRITVSGQSKYRISTVNNIDGIGTNTVDADYIGTRTGVGNTEYYCRCKNSTTYDEYVIYTNGNKLDIGFVTDKRKYENIGNITVSVDDGVITKYWNSEDAISNSIALTITPSEFELTSNTEHKIVVTINSDLRPNGIAQTYQINNENDLVNTHGTDVLVLCSLVNKGDVSDHRLFVIKVGGSCDREFNENNSGIDLSWDELYQYYKEGNRYDPALFTNTGNTLSLFRKYNDSGVVTDDIINPVY